MKPAARTTRSAGKPRRKLGTLLALLGLLAVLGVTFTAGALAGRLSLRPSASSAQGTERAARNVTPPQPELTFYRELTAPLAPRPVPPKPTARPGKREAPPPESARTAEAPAAESDRRTDGPKPAEATRPAESPRAADAKAVDPPKMPETTAPATAAAPRSDAGRYTIQVGAYSGRSQAEALKARLVADGHEAYVTEADPNGAARYKVRIGSYPSAEEARKAAARLASRSQVATYITTR